MANLSVGIQKGYPMRLSEILLEIGKSPLHYMWLDDNTALFDIGDTKIVVEFIKSRNSSYCDVSFAETSGDEAEYDLVDAGGNEIKIMSTVAAITEAYYLRTKDEYDILGASAEDKDSSVAYKRMSMYTRFFENMAKKYGGKVQLSMANRTVQWYINENK